MNKRPLTPALAGRILARIGESGQPPEVGVEHLNVGNESLLGVLDSEYLEPISATRRGSTFKLVQAYYGGGKTHFLLCARQAAFARSLAAAIVSLSPEETPFDDPVRIYQAVAREIAAPPLDPDVPPARGIEIALRVFVEERLEGLDHAARVAWVDQLRRIPVDAPACRAAVVAFARAIVDDDPGKEDIAGAWLRGETLRAEEIRPLGIRENLERSNAFRMLRSLCQLLQGIGVPGLLLAFDEADRTLSVSSRRKRAIADNLRQLIDHCGQEHLPGLVCLYAVPPEFMREVVTEYPALQQRLEGPATLSRRSPQAAIIDLENLDLDPEDLLVQIGLRILLLVEVARGVSLDPRLQEQNLRRLAEHVLERSFEVAHRRAYVKAAVDLLQQQIHAENAIAYADIIAFTPRVPVAELPGGDDF